MIKPQLKYLTTTLSALILTVFSIACTPPQPSFDGNRALEYVSYQVGLGPRTVGSEAHAKEVDWIVAELNKSGWQTEIQESEVGGINIKNIVGKRGSTGPWIILGAHYDTRLTSDRDPNPILRNLPLPGANDGASGVAVLLELARTLPENLPLQLWLVFFDAEENNDSLGMDWIMGSRAFVQQLAGKPIAAIIVDMVGDADLNLCIEKNSDPQLVSAIWKQAEELGYEDTFISQPKYSLIDDHQPFLEAGIPAIDIIDFDYPYWHTSQDTLDKVSAESLEIVGKTLYAWLKNMR
jgi:Zn-dependent M28 family amino/carboxypeptidase